MRNRDYLQQMGSKIRSVRVRAGLTQKQVAELVPMKRYSLTKIECGRADSHILMLKRIADVLGVDIKELL